MNIEYLEEKITNVKEKVSTLLSFNQNILNPSILTFNNIFSSTYSQNIYSKDNIDIVYIEDVYLEDETKNNFLEIIISFNNLDEFKKILLSDNITLEPFFKFIEPLFNKIVNITLEAATLTNSLLEYKTYIILEFNKDNELYKIKSELICDLDNQLYFYNFSYDIFKNFLSEIKFNTKVKNYNFYQDYQSEEIYLLDFIKNHILTLAVKSDIFPINVDHITIDNYPDFVKIFNIAKY